MKLVLTSSSFEQKDILSSIEKLAQKPAKDISVCVINEAFCVEEGDKRWLINGLADLARVFGGEIDIVNLLALPKSEVMARINKCDIIFCFGGSTEWLKSVFDKTEFSSILPDILNNKVWVGSSAGSMIVGKMPSTKQQDFVYGVTDYYGVDEYLALVNFSIFPHIFGEFAAKNSFDRCVAESKSQAYPVYVLSDEASVVVEGDNVYLAGNKGFKLVNGEIVEQV